MNLAQRASIKIKSGYEQKWEASIISGNWSILGDWMTEEQEIEMRLNVAAESARM